MPETTVQDKKTSSKGPVPNLKEVQDSISKQYSDASVKFLWFRDGVYRFRVNRWTSEGIVASIFVLAQITPDGVVHRIRSDEDAKKELKSFGTQSVETCSPSK